MEGCTRTGIVERISFIVDTSNCPFRIAGRAASYQKSCCEKNINFSKSNFKLFHHCRCPIPRFNPYCHHTRCPEAIANLFVSTAGLPLYRCCMQVPLQMYFVETYATMINDRRIEATWSRETRWSDGIWDANIQEAIATHKRRDCANPTHKNKEEEGKNRKYYYYHNKTHDWLFVWNPSPSTQERHLRPKRGSYIFVKHFRISFSAFLIAKYLDRSLFPAQPTTRKKKISKCHLIWFFIFILFCYYKLFRLHCLHERTFESMSLLYFVFCFLVPSFLSRDVNTWSIIGTSATKAKTCQTSIWRSSRITIGTIDTYWNIHWICKWFPWMVRFIVSTTIFIKSCRCRCWTGRYRNTCRCWCCYCSYMSVVGVVIANTLREQKDRNNGLGSCAKTIDKSHRRRE